MLRYAEHPNSNSTSTTWSLQTLNNIIGERKLPGGWGGRGETPPSRSMMSAPKRQVTTSKRRLDSIYSGLPPHDGILPGIIIKATGNISQHHHPPSHHHHNHPHSLLPSAPAAKSQHDNQTDYTSTCCCCLVSRRNCSPFQKQRPTTTCLSFIQLIPKTQSPLRFK